jgi:Ca2+-binding EF-hand superfamily protein
MKSFKYFDLNNNGTVEPDEFAKAIEKIGIMIPTRQVSLITSPLVSMLTFASCDALLPPDSKFKL